MAYLQLAMLISNAEAKQQAYDLTLACADRGDRHCVAAHAAFAQGFARVTECSRQGFALCSATLTSYHHPARDPATLPPGFKPDPAERLRLLELAISQGMPQLAAEMRRLRLESGLLHIAVRPGRHLLSGRIDRQGRAGSSGNYRGDCDIAAAGEQQYRFECKLGVRMRVSTGVVKADRLRMSVDGFDLEFLLREVAAADGQSGDAAARPLGRRSVERVLYGALRSAPGWRRSGSGWPARSHGAADHRPTDALGVAVRTPMRGGAAPGRALSRSGRTRRSICGTGSAFAR